MHTDNDKSIFPIRFFIKIFLLLNIDNNTLFKGDFYIIVGSVEALFYCKSNNKEYGNGKQFPVC